MSHEKCDWFSTGFLLVFYALILKEFIYKLSIINKCLNTHVHTISSNLLVLDLT